MPSPALPRFRSRQRSARVTPLHATRPSRCGLRAFARCALCVGRDAQHRRRITLLAELRLALESDGLQLVYQPKVDMGTRTVKSVEALARWTHTHLGVVSPGEFVPLAEQTGNSRRLTSWVLGAAIRQMEAWRRDGLDIDVAVNLSASTFSTRSSATKCCARCNAWRAAGVAAAGDHGKRSDARPCARRAQHAASSGLGCAVLDR